MALHFNAILSQLHKPVSPFAGPESKGSLPLSLNPGNVPPQLELDFSDGENV